MTKKETQECATAKSVQEQMGMAPEILAEKHKLISAALRESKCDNCGANDGDETSAFETMSAEEFVKGAERILERMKEMRPASDAIALRIDQLYEKMGEKFEPGKQIFVKDFLPLGRDLVRRVLADAVGTNVFDDGEFFSWVRPEKNAAPVRFKIGDSYELSYMENGIIVACPIMGTNGRIFRALGFDPQGKGPEYGDYLWGKYDTQCNSFELTSFDEAEQILMGAAWGGPTSESKGRTSDDFLEKKFGDAVIDFFKCSSDDGRQGVDYYVLSLEQGSELYDAVHAEWVKDREETKEDEEEFCQKRVTITMLDTQIRLISAIINEKSKAIKSMIRGIEKEFFPVGGEINFDDSKIIALGARVPRYEEFFENCTGKILDPETCIMLLQSEYDYDTPLEELTKMLENMPLLNADLLSAFEICKTRVENYEKFAPKFAYLNEKAQTERRGNVRVFATSAQLTLPRVEFLPNGSREIVRKFNLIKEGLMACDKAITEG